MTKTTKDIKPKKVTVKSNGIEYTTYGSTGVQPIFKVTKTTGLPTHDNMGHKLLTNKEMKAMVKRLPPVFVGDKKYKTVKEAIKATSDKDFSRFAPKTKMLASNDSVESNKLTFLPDEIEGDYVPNKWTFMCLILAVAVILLVAMHSDYLAVSSGYTH